MRLKSVIIASDGLWGRLTHAQAAGVSVGTQVDMYTRL